MPVNPSRPADCHSEPAPERRRGERYPADGEVVLILRDPGTIEIRGRLADISPEGFRASHRHVALCTGQLVSFHHEFADGLAKVVWNRVLGDRVESGFFILIRVALEAEEQTST